MFISLESRHANRFAKWRGRFKPCSNDNDDPGHDDIVSMSDPDLGRRATAPSEQPHQPWHVPGIGVSL